MNTKARIVSILKTNQLGYSITGLETFDLSELEVSSDLEFKFPTNLRLGHLAEKIVSELIKASSNYKVLYENIQVIEDKQTIGELDFIIEELKTKQVIHLELAYKFYLYDPSISKETINNWIGPNRNDSLKEKLNKLKEKQFPLLYHHRSKSIFADIDLNKVSQALCLLVSLFVPYKFKTSLNSIYEKAIKGYYIKFETFTNLDHSSTGYYIPPKKEWGMDPNENEVWNDYNDIEEYIKICMIEKQAPLCWQKSKESYLAFFVVWW